MSWIGVYFPSTFSIYRPQAGKEKEMMQYSCEASSDNGFPEQITGTGPETPEDLVAETTAEALHWEQEGTSQTVDTALLRRALYQSIARGNALADAESEAERIATRRVVQRATFSAYSIRNRHLM